jgi:hypothetical protein
MDKYNVKPRGLMDAYKTPRELMGAYNETPREVTLRDLMGACHLT